MLIDGSGKLMEGRANVRNQIEKVFDVACTLVDVMSCVPPSPTQHPSSTTNPQNYLNQLLTLISTLRGGEARYLPLVMTKIRDTLPSIGPALPQHLVMRAAMHQRGSSSLGNLGTHVGGADGSGTGMSNGNFTTFVNGSLMTSHTGSGPRVNVKRESGSSSTSGASSPYETPSFLHYYPLA